MIPVQLVNCASATAQIIVQGTEVVLGTRTTAEFLKSERTPAVSGSVDADLRSAVADHGRWYRVSLGICMNDT